MKKLFAHPIAIYSLLLFFPTLLALVLGHYYSEMKELSEIHAHLASMQSKVEKYHLLKEKESSFFNQFENASPLYIENSLESLSLLSTEGKKFRNRLRPSSTFLCERVSTSKSRKSGKTWRIVSRPTATHVQRGLSSRK